MDPYQMWNCLNNITNGGFMEERIIELIENKEFIELKKIINETSVQDLAEWISDFHHCDTAKFLDLLEKIKLLMSLVNWMYQQLQIY